METRDKRSKQGLVDALCQRAHALSQPGACSLTYQTPPPPPPTRAVLNPISLDSKCRVIQTFSPGAIERTTIDVEPRYLPKPVEKKDQNGRCFRRLQFPLPGRDDEGRKVVYISTGGYDPKEVPLADVLKIGFMTTDIMLLEEETQVRATYGLSE